MVPGYRSGAKIAEAPPLVNSNIAEISKNTNPRKQGLRNSLISCVVTKYLSLPQPD